MTDTLDAAKSADHADQGLDFDPDALREKYRQERDKRLRADGSAQYREIAGAFSHYLNDPYVAPGFTREPLTDEVGVVVVGGGFGGLLAGARLSEAGVEDVRIIEKGGDFGGTWYWNRYPGAQCDIESYCYLPLLEELGYMPKEKYSYVTEIFEHSQRVGKAYDLYDVTYFQTRVKDLQWDDDAKRWLVHTNRDDEIKARFVIMALGTASRAKLPGIPGVEDFEGYTFHTSRWDYGYTGGSTLGDLHKLADKRVAIIGTGATSIQCVPHVGRDAKQLYVFQRTPSSVDIRGNKPTDHEWAKTLQPGWQRARRQNFASIVEGRPFTEDLVSDAWTDIFRSLQTLGPSAAKGDLTAEEVGKLAEIADFKKMNQIRARVDENVTNKQAAEALKPWYRQFCKRPTFNDDYLPTFNRPNVTLVDTQGKGVDRVTEKGLVVDGVEYEVDCIIFATGFEVGTAYTRRAGFEIYGKDGKTLTDHWSDGTKTLHGLYSNGFPNCFHLGINQNTLTPNFPHILDEQSRHIAGVVKEANERQAQRVEPTAEAESGWVKTITENSNFDINFRTSCTPGYYNGEGRAGEGKGLFDGLYGPGPVAFFELMQGWRESGGPGLEIA